MAEEDDAREEGRRAVRDVFARDAEAPPRTCPACGREARTRFETCPHCAASYFVKPPRLGRRARVGLLAAALVVVVVALVLGLGAALRSKDDREARERADLGRVAARERQRVAAEQVPVRGRARSASPPAADARPSVVVRARRALVGEMESAILADAVGRVARGRLKGPVRSATCGPLSPTTTVPTPELDPALRAGRYSCVATVREVTSAGKLVGRFGYDYVGTADFRRFSWVICLNHPPPSENGVPLVRVRLAPACLGLGKNAVPVGSGYAEPESP